MLSLFAQTNFDLEHTVNELSLTVIWAAAALLVPLVLVGVWAVRKKHKRLLRPIYMLIVFVVASATLTVTSATVYLNVKSPTGGPVHWHADFEFWACGNELALRDPQGFLSNKIGTPTLHEHNDKRIHLEGVPITLPYDASLGKFMDVVGGQVDRNTLVVPLNDDYYFEEDYSDGDGLAAVAPELIDPFIRTNDDGTVAEFANGQLCGEEESEVQVFVYQYNEHDKTYRQTKLDDPFNYAITGEDQVPPGDCVIFEFGPVRERTDKLCEQYGVRDLEKCERFGVPSDKRSVCEIREVY
jgi:hypothetical protein